MTTMQILSLEKEDQASIIERNGLLYTEKENKNKPLQELEEAFQQSTSDLPVGKAIHLLLHIHGQVLEKAIKSIRESTPNEHILLMADSPTVRSILSLEHYLARGDTQAHFRHFYDPLKEKILKKNASETALRLVCYFLLYASDKTQIRQFFIQELEASDKRSQLAAAIVLQFLHDNYLLETNELGIATLFLPRLVNLTNAKTPTILACTAFEIAVHLCKYTLNHTQNDQVNTVKIVEIESFEGSSTHLECVWTYIDTLLINLESWQKNKTELEIEAFNELHRYIRDVHLFDTGSLIAAWDSILSFTLPKKILSPKPLPLKKQEECMDSPSISANLKMVILALLQKGQWVANYSEPVTLLSTDEERQKVSLQRIFRDMDFALPGGHLIPVIAMLLPYLCTLDHIQDPKAIQAILEQPTDTSDATLKRLTPLVLNQPDSSVCQLLLHVVQEDNHAKFAFEFLSFLIASAPDQIIPIVEVNVLSVLKRSNQACELLIKAMPYTNLTLLIKKLMKLVFTAQDKDKERMVYIALISKVLLEPRWASDSIMVYIDFIRDVKEKKKLVFPPASTENLQALTPQTMVSYQHKDELLLDKEDIDLAYPVLLGSIQLWSSRVDAQVFETAMKQFVHYSYGIPTDNTCIDAWKNLSFAFMNNHPLVWYVIEPCLNRMKTQMRITHEKPFKVKESILFLRLNPMLILQTLPKETYDVVQLPNSYINLKQKQLQMLGVDLRNIRVCSSDRHSKLSIELMDELLQRSFETKDLGDNLQSPVDFAASLLLKIFC